MPIYLDYKEQAFTDSQVTYNVGTALGTTFVATQFMFYATEDCYVRFDSDSSLQVLIKSGWTMVFEKKAKQLWITRKTTSGTLDIWAQGDLTT